MKMLLHVVMNDNEPGDPKNTIVTITDSDGNEHEIWPRRTVKGAHSVEIGSEYLLSIKQKIVTNLHNVVTQQSVTTEQVDSLINNKPGWWKRFVQWFK